MIQKRMILSIACFLFSLQVTYAQSFEYKREVIDNRQFEDVCIEYVRDMFNVGDKKITILGMTHYPLPNGNTFVFLRVKWVGLTYYEEHQVPGSLVWSKKQTETIYLQNQIEDARRCALVVNPSGFVNSWFKIPDNFSIWRLSNNVLCFLIDKSVISVNSHPYTCYNYINCRDYDGNLLWEADNDLMAFDLLKTENNLYVAGEKVGDEVRSLIRGYNIATGKIVREKIGNKEGVCLGLKKGDNGLEYYEYLKSENTSQSFSIPYEENDIASRRREIMNSYDQNKADDQVQIGERYLKGNGFNKDEKKAVEWFRKAANQNNSKGLERLAYCYKNGLGVNQDKTQAANYYEKAADLNNKDAILALSDMYAVGDGIEKSISRALSLKEILAFEGNIEAQKFVMSNQSVEYAKMDISPSTALIKARNSYDAKKFDWATFCYERAISLGNKDAMFEYGKWLYEGVGITKDCKKAIEYLSKLGEENNLKAQVLLAHIYTDNKGVTPDAKQEMYWRMKAAENGDTESIMKLATAYQNGIGVKKNKKLAFQMFERAAKNGNKDAIKQTVLCYALGFGVKKDILGAAVWAEDLNYEDQLAIAKMFYYGDGVKKNMKLSILIWEYLSEKYVFKAINNLALINIWSGNYSKAERLIGSIDNIPNMSYPNRASESYYLLGILREAQGRYQQALDCYKNSRKEEAKQLYNKLHERWARNNFR